MENDLTSEEIKLFNEYINKLINERIKEERYEEAAELRDVIIKK